MKIKIYFSWIILALVCCFTASAQRTYVGSTPAHATVREFLQISLTDSIDFIRWQLTMGSNHYELQCQYGLVKAGTPGFTNEKKVAFSGELRKTTNQYYLQHQVTRLSLLEVNADLFHLLDKNNKMLVGNGGYSYALNSTKPTKTAKFNLTAEPNRTTTPEVFEGRTPCQELATLLGLQKSAACNKMKWYFIFYKDSLSGKPSHYLKGGIGYRKETMEKGKWQIINKEGRIIYKVIPDNQPTSLYLLKGDNNILFFIYPDGRLLVGNEDFSYTLNRRKEEYQPVQR